LLSSLIPLSYNLQDVVVVFIITEIGKIVAAVYNLQEM
jgi:hypothetical protein